MAQQTINIGAAANDGTGDPLRDAFDKVNDNFTELYAVDPVPKAGGTMTGDLTVPSEAYGVSWNGSNEVPTKNDVYDKIETITGGTGGGFLPLTGGTLSGDLAVPADPYGAGWNGNNAVPTKNDVYDKIESLAVGGGTGDVVGPASSVDGHVALFDSTTGKLLKDSGAAVLANGATITPAATPATNAVGYLGCPQNQQDANYTTVMSDAGKHLYHTSASTHTWTIDSNANVAYPIGTILTFINANGGGNVTIAITSDTLRWGTSTGSRTLAANGVATAIKVTSTTWRLTGDGIT